MAWAVGREGESGRVFILEKDDVWGGHYEQVTSPEITVTCGILIKSKGEAWLRLLDVRFFLAMSSQQQAEWKEEEVLRTYTVLKSNYHMEWPTFLPLYLLIHFKQTTN